MLSGTPSFHRFGSTVLGVKVLGAANTLLHYFLLQNSPAVGCFSFHPCVLGNFSHHNNLQQHGWREVNWQLQGVLQVVSCFSFTFLARNVNLMRCMDTSMSDEWN
ncbi:hypothetical protein O6P43_029981 [Quillaja saponaria]|uniref:Uncharacterized protein n=1 Tax=Quillaja saponaria TaxID=32244 RepID=A0AAD7L1V4_QUISA|nr:hypothetical protein O6P43_029981 [Quillaja saponaria]